MTWLTLRNSSTRGILLSALARFLIVNLSVNDFPVGQNDIYVTSFTKNKCSNHFVTFVSASYKCQGTFKLLLRSVPVFASSFCFERKSSILNNLSCKITKLYIYIAYRVTWCSLIRILAKGLNKVETSKFNIFLPFFKCSTKNVGKKWFSVKDTKMDGLFVKLKY